MSISKPQSAYQFYLKAWKEIPAEKKAYFEDNAKSDLQRYKEQYTQIEYVKEAEVKEKEIYLKAYT